MCYSWWVLASLAMLGRLHWIDKQKMVTFILACQVNITFTTSNFMMIFRITRLGGSRTGRGT